MYARASIKTWFSATSIQGERTTVHILGEAVRIFLRGFPLFFATVNSAILETTAGPGGEICRRFVGGSANRSALLGTQRQTVQDMQNVQSRINTGYFASR